MICIYEIAVRAVCAVDGARDVYILTLESHDPIRVETIVQMADRLTAHPVLQEDMTRDFARNLGCTVTSVGYHSGVRTTVVCP